MIGRQPPRETDASVFHLVPEPVWEARVQESPYVPESCDQEGFIDCTMGEAGIDVCRVARAPDGPFVEFARHE